VTPASFWYDRVSLVTGGGAEVADLGSELVDLGGQREDECPQPGCHLGGEFGRDATIGGSRHAANVAGIDRPEQINRAGCEPLPSRST